MLASQAITTLVRSVPAGVLRSIIDRGRVTAARTLSTAIVVMSMSSAIEARVPHAQRDEGTIAGRVLDAEHLPVAGARVVLVSRPIPWCADDDHERRVSVTSDGKGRFRVAVPGAWTWSAWASTADRATRVAEGVEPDSFVTLEIDPLSARETCVVSGLEPWQARAPLRWRVQVGSENLDYVALEADGEKVTVPPLPFLDCRQIDLLGGDGEVLWSQRLPGDGRIAVPPPREIAVLVRHAGTGEPIAGADLRVHLLNHWFTQSPAIAPRDRFVALWPRVGVTDAQGRAMVLIPEPGASSWMMAGKDGFRSSPSGVQESRWFVDGAFVEGTPEVLEFHLPPVADKPIPIRFDGEPGSASDLARIEARVWVRDGRSGTGTPIYVPTRVGPQDLGTQDPGAQASSGIAGITGIAALAAGSDVESISFLVPDALRRAQRERFAVALPLAMRWRNGSGPIGEVIDPSELLGHLVAVEVADTDGVPASGVVVSVGYARDPRRKLYEDTLGRTDRRGRALLACSDAPLRIEAFGDGAFGSVEIAPDARLEGIQHLRMEPLRRILVQIVDGEGKPIGGIAVGADHFDPSPGDAGRFTRDALTRLAAAQPARLTDAEGRVRVAFPPVAGSLRLELRDPASPRRSIGTIVLDHGDGDEDREVVLQFDKPR